MGKWRMRILFLTPGLRIFGVVGPQLPNGRSGGPGYQPGSKVCRQGSNVQSFNNLLPASPEVHHAIQRKSANNKCGYCSYMDNLMKQL